MTTVKKDKIEWLALLQGYSMLLVVIGHVSLTNVTSDTSTPIATGIERIIYSFHMTLFIFISGWLFYYTCLRKKKLYKEVVYAKLKRLGVPFLTFTILATILKSAYPSLMHRPVTVQELVDTFLLFKSNPLVEMWFVVVLFILMLMYPIYISAIKQKWSVYILSAVSLIVFIVPLPIKIFNIDIVCHMAPFFVAGILCSRYEWDKYLWRNKWLLCISSVMFVLWNVLDIMPDPMNFISISIGIFFSFSLCINLSKYRPMLFNSFRDYTFQIFLMGIFFQMVIRWAYVKWGSDMFFVPMWLLSVIIGVYAPTFIAKIIDKKAPKYVKMCFGL